MNLSLCMIVRDEEDNLKDCLLPLRQVCDELIVVDTGSRDHTPRIAKMISPRREMLPCAMLKGIGFSGWTPMIGSPRKGPERCEG